MGSHPPWLYLDSLPKTAIPAQQARYCSLESPCVLLPIPTSLDFTSSNASSMRLTAYLLTTRPNSPNCPARLFIWPHLLHPPPRGFSRQAGVSLSTRPVFPVAPALSFPPLLNPFPSLTSHPSCCSSTDHKWRLEKQPPAPSQRKQKRE